MDEDQLSDTFAALADPVRRAILTRLAAGDATLNELAEPFSISVQAISKHLKVLERAGLITRSRDAQRRPARLETAPLEATVEWIERHRRLKEEQLDRLGQTLRDLTGEKETAP
ncbi:MAG TPA: metalloregulator ArsR/SmtB family transcription factor [Mycobacteriales bacterium]|nr:metalloregulator ArsR/SmtB family transcription factor [Mycobacteriales bacterium]